MMAGSNGQGTRFPLPYVPKDEMLELEGEPKAISSPTPSKEASNPASHSTPIIPKHPPDHHAGGTILDALLPTDLRNPDLVKTLRDQVFDQVIQKLQLSGVTGPNLVGFSAPGQPHDMHSPQSPSPSSIASFSLPLDSPSSHKMSDEVDSNDGWVSLSQATSHGHRNVVQKNTPAHYIHGSTPHDTISTPITEGGQTTQTSGRHEFPFGSDFSLKERQHIGGGTSPTDPMPEYKSNVKANHSNSSVSVPRTPSGDRYDPFEPTVLEKAWQPLFDNHGNPSLRLSQFLRGIAKYLIESFEPKQSLVVTPAKMLRFFDETKILEEVYPWSTIFSGRISPTSLSTIYRKLLCEHHLVQKSRHDFPTIPGLTAKGFDSFMTCLIQAHPDAQYRRLSLAIQQMPISNADDPRERFPKELSRRLLPACGEVQAEQRLISSLIDLELPLVSPEYVVATMPPPPEHPLSSQSFAIPERERNPYSRSSQSSNAVDDYNDADNISPLARPIERQRMPYHAKEGSGKIYETSNAQNDERGRTRNTVSIKSTPHSSHSRPADRTQEHTSLGRSASYKGSNKVELNKSSPPKLHRNSTSQARPPPLNNTQPGSTRRSSSPPWYSSSRNDQIYPGGSPFVPKQQTSQPVSTPASSFGNANNDSHRLGNSRSNASSGTVYHEDASSRAKPIPPGRSTTASSRPDAGQDSPTFGPSSYGSSSSHHWIPPSPSRRSTNQYNDCDR